MVRPAYSSRGIIYTLMLQLTVGVEATSLTRRFTSCPCQVSFSPYDKTSLSNMIALVKWTNYSPLTTIQTHFYWSIQPNKTLLHVRKGTAILFACLFQAQRLYDPSYYTSVTFKLYWTRLHNLWAVYKRLRDLFPSDGRRAPQQSRPECCVLTWLFGCSFDVFYTLLINITFSFFLKSTNRVSKCRVGSHPRIKIRAERNQYWLSLWSLYQFIIKCAN